MSRVFWIGEGGVLMEYDGTMPSHPVSGVMRSDLMTLDEAKAKYPEFFRKETQDGKTI